MMTLVSMSSKSRGLQEYVKTSEEYEFLKDEQFAQGDVITTLIKCANGELISIKLDTTLPRAYSREFTVSGTKGMYSEPYNCVLNDEFEYNHEQVIEAYRDNVKPFEEKYLPKIWKEITEEEIESGHGGMDVFVLRAFFKMSATGGESPIDVYDAAAWMAITCLSEESISKGGAPVEIPDFTSGKWVSRDAKDVVEFI